MLKSVKVKSIKPVWVEQTYDIEMSKNHNFVANWIVTHNSHSAAYWKLAWIWGYYKANYPIEFYCWMLQTLGQVSWKVEGTEKDKIFMLLNDYKDHWYKLLYPDINKSDITFKIDKNIQTWQELIRVWFNYIKWVWEKQAIEIAKKQPYDDYYDFLKKVDRRVVNSKVVQIIKQMWLFNSIWWAPDIDEKLVPEVNSIELIRESSLKLLEIFKEIRSWKDSSVLFNEDWTVWEERNSLVELYDLFWLDEDKYLETNLKELTYWDLKKIITKIKSKLKSFIDKVQKKKPFYEQLDEKFIIEWNQVKDKLDETLKYIEDELKLLKKKADKRNKEVTIWTPDRHRLFEDLYPDQISLFEKLNKLNELTIKDLSQLEWIQEKDFELYLAIFSLEKELQGIIQYIDSVLVKVDLDKTCVEIKPSIHFTMKTCSILLNVDLKEYAPIVPYLHNFTPLKYITFKEDVKFLTSVWVIMDKVILNDQMKEDWSGVNYNKTKVRASIMIGDIKLPLFINWHTYIKNKNILDEIVPWDPIVIKFNLSNGFTMIQVTEIVKAEEFKRKVDNKISFDEREQKFLKPSPSWFWNS